MVETAGKTFKAASLNVQLSFGTCRDGASIAIRRVAPKCASTQDDCVSPDRNGTARAPRPIERRTAAMMHDRATNQ